METKINLERVLRNFSEYTESLIKHKIHPEYAQLQSSWNTEVIKYSARWMPLADSKIISMGAFTGPVEMAFKDEYTEVVCVDHQSFLPRWKPKNVKFVAADLDSSTWVLPEEHFDVCFMNEIIEHFLWSPVPLLKWVSKHSHVLVISTPDDDEWPPMSHPWCRYQHFSAIPSAFPGSKGNPKPMFHTKQYKQYEFMELLDKCGFRVMEFVRIGEGKHQMLAIAQPKLS